MRISTAYHPKDYIITPYIGEFMNTLTNIIYGERTQYPHNLIRRRHTNTFSKVIYGTQGLRRVGPRPDGGLFSTLAFPYWALIGVGVLSAWFHATLKYHSQMGDDLSMFLAVGALLHQLLCYEATPTQRIKYTAFVLGTLIPVSIYHVWADEIYVHEIVFAIYIFLISRRTRALIKLQVKSEESKKRLGSMATFGICMSFFEIYPRERTSNIDG
jgi:dihydroceramidase